MALVFSLRLLNLGLTILVLSGTVFFIGITDSRQSESLAVLFSVFLLMVGVSLLWIRLDRHLDQLLLVAPLGVFLLPAPAFQLPFLILSLLLLFQGLAGGARRFGSRSLFHLAQLAWVLLWVAGASLPEPYKIGAVFTVGLTLLGVLFFGFRDWQKSIKRVMESLDQDRES